MTHANFDLSLRSWSQLALALVVLPAMLALAGCDSGGNNGGNQPPDAEFAASKGSGLTVNFDASNSQDSDGSIAEYKWNFGDGTTDSTSKATTSHTYNKKGGYEVTLTVEDDKGATDDVTESITTSANLEYANYDTTETAIVFSERSGNDDGVVPKKTSFNENVRKNYVKWTNEHTYHIDGRTFVNSGDTLEIEPGTVIKGVPNQDPNNASVLIVAKGGTIIANGNPGSSDPSQANPIIFTTREDDVSNPNDLQRNLNGAWGGVIILGNAPGNWPSARQIEGIPSDVTRARYGSSSGDPADDSGVFRFVSIRYGGISIGAGNEINGLSLGAVGTGTTVEYVEIFNNQDDGIEWFGGTVNAKNLVVSRVGDDSYDIDQGYSGNLQFLLAIQHPGNNGGRTGEHDSGDSDYGASDEGDKPFSDPQIYNATYIGSGPDGGGDIALKLRDNFAGNYFNSVFYDFPAQFIEVEDISGKIDSRKRWEKRNLTVESSVMWKFGSVSSGQSTEETFDALVENETNATDTGWGDEVADSLQAYGNQYADPGLSRNLSSSPYQTVGVVPSQNVSSGKTPPSGFEQVTYKGAFKPNGSNWAKGWTFTDEVGMFQ